MNAFREFQELYHAIISQKKFLEGFIMKILHIVPEFQEGGVERYVVQLSHEQVNAGHDVILATSGGKLESLLPENVQVIHLPVHRKNLFTIIYSAHKLAGLHDINIIHAHSRVPAWIAWRISSLKKISWLMTAHAPYSLNAGLLPLRHADGVICISESVKNHMRKYLPVNNANIARIDVSASAKI